MLIILLVLAAGVTPIPGGGGSSVLRGPSATFSDTLLLSVRNAETGESATVEAILAADSALFLPAADLARLLGVKLPPSAFVSARDIERAYGGVVLVVDLRELTVFVHDPNHVLPATRAFFEGVSRVLRAQAPNVTAGVSGPLASLAGDDHGNTSFELGYALRFAAVEWRRSRLGDAWAISIVPSPAVFVSYSGGERQPAAVTARVAKGPVWVQPTWTAEHGLRVDALVALGGVSLYASRNTLLLTTTKAAPVGLQLGRSGGVTAFRFSFGAAAMPSAFLFPSQR